MAELKEAPRPKTENGSGQSKEIAPRTAAAPMKSTGNAYAYMRRFVPMQPFRTILFTADFSENSKEAFRAACTLAENETRLIVLHVVEPSFVAEEPVYYGQQVVQFFPKELDRAQHEALREKMRLMYAPDHCLDLEYETREGDASAEILRMASEIGSDVIVMGTHGLTGLQRVLTGSVAVDVLRGAHCPVMALRSAAEPRTTKEFQSILHPTDFSIDAEAALRVASRLAREHGARLVILHVESLDVLSYGTPADEIDPRVFKKALDGVRKRIEGPDLKYPVETALKRGFVPDGIIETAQEMDCDLIVMGTHGRTGLSRLLMGSIAEHVLRKASCPVLMVKTGRRAAAGASKQPADKMATVP